MAQAFTYSEKTPADTFVWEIAKKANIAVKIKINFFT